MNEALLAILSALVAALIWLVKSMQARSDRMMEQRDKEVGRLIGALESAVNIFADFQEQESEVHAKIVSDSLEAAKIHALILDEIKTMRKKLPATQP